MNFELINVSPVGGLTTISANTSSQWLNITVGVSGNPYTDIVAIRTVAYEFSDSIPVSGLTSGFTSFATAWIATNYPNI